MSKPLVQVGSVVAGALALAMVLALGSASWHAAPSHAQAPTPIPGTAEMAIEADGCDSDCFFAPGSDFTISVLASDPPADGMGGFQAEVFASGVTYNAADCASTVKMEPVELCLGPTVGTPSGQVIVGAVTGFPTGEPVPESTSEVLAELSYTCAEEGEHDIVLSAYDLVYDGNGSKYSDLIGADVYLRTSGTHEQMLQGQPDPVELPAADSLTVTCGEPPQPTAATTAGPAVSPTAAGFPGTGTGGLDNTGTGAITWVVLAALTAAAGSVLGLAGWRVARDRRA